MRLHVPATRAEARTRVASPETSSNPRPVASAATGHCEFRPVQAVLKPRLNHLVPFSGDERDDPDAQAVHRLPRRPRYRSADEGPDAEVCQADCLSARRTRGKSLFRHGKNSPGLGLDDVKIPRRVEDGRDPAVPAGEGRLRSSGSSVSIHDGDVARASPASGAEVDSNGNHST